jgi:hypothetical protein
MVWTFSIDVCARVGPMTEWAFVRRDVSISLGDFAVVELAVNEFKEGGALLRVGI